MLKRRWRSLNCTSGAFVVSSIRKRSSGCTWLMVCTSLQLSSSSRTSSGPSEMSSHGTGRPLNPWPTLVLRSLLLQSFQQTHTLASTRDSKLLGLGFRGCRSLICCQVGPSLLGSLSLDLRSSCCFGLSSTPSSIVVTSPMRLLSYSGTFRSGLRWSSPSLLRWVSPITLKRRILC